MATFNITDAPQRLEMSDFQAINEKHDGLAKSCRYTVRIFSPPGILDSGGIAQDLTYLCEATEFPGRSFTNIDLRYYGPTFKLPNMSVYEDINMTFLCRNRSLEREFFDDWMELINPTNSFDFNYRMNYGTTIELFQHSETHDATYEFTLYDAFPIFINPQPVTWTDDSMQKLTVTFTFSKWRRKDKDDTALNRYPLAPEGVAFTNPVRNAQGDPVPVPPVTTGGTSGSNITGAGGVFRRDKFM
jgi:hypothetical protein